MSRDLPNPPHTARLRDLGRRAGHRGLTWHAYLDRMVTYVAISAGVGFVLGYLVGLLGR